MSISTRIGKRALAVVVGSTLVVTGLTWLPSQARQGGPAPDSAAGGFGGGADGGGFGGSSEHEPAPRVHVAAPISAKAAAIWAQLNEKIDMSFPQETPLKDVLGYIRQATDCEELPGGLPFYLDPKGLMNAEKTEDSVVKIDLKGVPLATTLTLTLGQLDLAYTVHNDGLVVIDSADDPGCPLTDRTPRVLDELRELRSEVAQLRRQVSELLRDSRGGPGRGGPVPKGAGFMGGMGSMMGPVPPTSPPPGASKSDAKSEDK